MILLVTIGLNVVFIMETGRRLKYQQQQLDQQYSAFLPTAVAAVSGKKILIFKVTLLYCLDVTKYVGDTFP